VALAEDKSFAAKIAQIRSSAENGDADSQVQLADIYRYGKGVKIDYKESFQWATKAAEQGNAQAQHYLGICYTYGMGVKMDPEVAFKWYLKAAEQGHVAGQYRAGECYMVGKGVPKDDSLAIQWLEKGANGGDTDAKENLGLLYCYRAEAAKKEFDASYENYYQWPPYQHTQQKAYMWCNLAATKGSARAAKNLKILTEIMSTVDIESAQKMSSEWKPNQ
jgi:TPR repeat protein